MECKTTFQQYFVYCLVWFSWLKINVYIWYVYSVQCIIAAFNVRRDIQPHNLSLTVIFVFHNFTSFTVYLSIVCKLYTYMYACPCVYAWTGDINARSSLYRFTRVYSSLPPSNIYSLAMLEHLPCKNPL